MRGFHRSVGVVIGVNGYTDGIPTLLTAVDDARSVAWRLQNNHGYDVTLLTDAEVTGAALRRVLQSPMSSDDRLLIYFAGHGVALDGDVGPEGFLLLHDAVPGEPETFFRMTELQELLSQLQCRHLLVVLDCCFAGAFRWSSTRHFALQPEVVYAERYERFIRDAAWQVIASAAWDQKAIDIIDGCPIGERGEENVRHSPFAAALLAALDGAADRPSQTVAGSRGDGVTTATELYLYLRDCVETTTSGRHRQTPSFWPLQRHDKGEYVFLTPGADPLLEPAPVLTRKNNPFRGLEPFEREHARFFFGRESVSRKLRAHVAAQPLSLVLGSSGSGKSSLVKAGLLSVLPAAEWETFTLRPGKEPLRTLQKVPLPSPDLRLVRRVAAWLAANPGRNLLLFVDQLEELITLAPNRADAAAFVAALAAALRRHHGRLRIVATLRSDFAPQLAGGRFRRWWNDARFLVPPLSQDELREAIEGPASASVLYYEPRELVDMLINEVAQTPGALPLLSFTLSELYEKYLARRASDRALTLNDYEAIGGVAGSLRHRATTEYNALDMANRDTMRRVLLRMVSLEGGELARRRLPRSELAFPNSKENERVNTVLAKFANARLIIFDSDPDGTEVVEPAHDALVRGWDLLLVWSRSREAQDEIRLRQLLTPAAQEWERSGRRGGLWDANPRLFLLRRPLSAGGLWLNDVEQRFARASFRRRRTIRLLLGLSTITTIFILCWLSWTRWQAIEKGLASAERAAEEAQTATHARTRADYLRAIDLIAEAEPDKALAYLARAIRIDPRNAKALSRLQRLIQEWRWALPLASVQYERPLQAISVSDGGETCHFVLGEGGDSSSHIARTWRWRSGEHLALPGEGITSVVSSPVSGLAILKERFAKEMLLFSVKDAKPLRLLPVISHALETIKPQIEQPMVAFHPESPLLAFATPDRIVLLDGNTGNTIREWPAPSSAVRSLIFSGDRLLVMMENGAFVLLGWDDKSLVPIYFHPQAHLDEAVALGFALGRPWIEANLTPSGLASCDVFLGVAGEPEAERNPQGLLGAGASKEFEFQFVSVGLNRAPDGSWSCLSEGVPLFQLRLHNPQHVIQYNQGIVASTDEAIYTNWNFPDFSREMPPPNLVGWHVTGVTDESLFCSGNDQRSVVFQRRGWGGSLGFVRTLANATAATVLTRSKYVIADSGGGALIFKWLDASTASSVPASDPQKNRAARAARKFDSMSGRWRAGWESADPSDFEKEWIAQGADLGVPAKLLVVQDTATNRTIRSQWIADWPEYSPQFDPREQLLAAAVRAHIRNSEATYSGGVLLISLNGDRKVPPFLDHPDCEDVSFSGDGLNIVSCGRHRVRLFRTSDFKVAREFSHLDVNAAAIEPSGKEIASASTNVRFWNTATGEQRGRPVELRWLPRTTPGKIKALCYSRDGRRLAVAQQKLVWWLDVEDQVPIAAPLFAGDFIEDLSLDTKTGKLCVHRFDGAVFEIDDPGLPEASSENSDDWAKMAAAFGGWEFDKGEELLPLSMTARLDRLTELLPHQGFEQIRNALAAHKLDPVALKGENVVSTTGSQSPSIKPAAESLPETSMPPSSGEQLDDSGIKLILDRVNTLSPGELGDFITFLAVSGKEEIALAIPRVKQRIREIAESGTLSSASKFGAQREILKIDAMLRVRDGIRNKNSAEAISGVAALLSLYHSMRSQRLNTLRGDFPPFDSKLTDRLPSAWIDRWRALGPVLKDLFDDHFEWDDIKWDELMAPLLSKQRYLPPRKVSANKAKATPRQSLTQLKVEAWAALTGLYQAELSMRGDWPLRFSTLMKKSLEERNGDKFLSWLNDVKSVPISSTAEARALASLIVESTNGDDSYPLAPEARIAYARRIVQLKPSSIPVMRLAAQTLSSADLTGEAVAAWRAVLECYVPPVEGAGATRPTAEDRAEAAWRHARAGQRAYAETIWTREMTAWPLPEKRLAEAWRLLVLADPAAVQAFEGLLSKPEGEESDRDKDCRAWVNLGYSLALWERGDRIAAGERLKETKTEIQPIVNGDHCPAVVKTIFTKILQ